MFHILSWCLFTDIFFRLYTPRCRAVSFGHGRDVSGRPAHAHDAQGRRLAVEAGRREPLLQGREFQGYRPERDLQVIQSSYIYHVIKVK